MLPKRRKIILESLYRDGFVQNSDLAKQLNVNIATIRRDIKELAKEYDMDVSYGGASLNINLEKERPITEKATKNIERKKVIAKKAADVIKDGEIIALNAGSTVPFILDYINPDIKTLHVVTLGLNIANKVSSMPFINLILAGGNYRSSSQTFWGNHAEHLLKQINIDKAFLGANAVDMEQGWTHPNMFEVETNRILLQNAKQSFLVADSSKYEKTALAKVCDLADLDYIITDDEFPEHYIEFCREKDIKIM